MKKVLITGANKSIGFEVAKQLLEKGFYVYLGSRNIENGNEALEELKSAGFSNAEAIEIDVTSDDSVKAARAEIGKKSDSLDVLINNAGVSGGQPQQALIATPEQFKQAFDTNVIGVARVTQAFIDLIKNSPEPRIVNVSSSQGSLTLANDKSNPYYNFKGAVYQPSKAALNMYSIALAFELRETAVKVNMVDPGFTKTDFNNHRGSGTVEEAATRIVKYALIDNDGPSGKFFSEEFFPEGVECPW
ncbi:SDR family oxidoreductase [Pedobacter endophyticus]|uniref:SDR family oxidoreductase n=1 Tax=Pedobacter endophyticus TaxID=2789740 RepID=A0A7U3Q587_9SPHI|nr:SDR family oxidoreductase [Pedobacter endophyticus]QPH38702.1 SDR family oxidoreductase [Pedobacter endophyticus]